jgi:tRNA(Ile)-lysidine synthase
MENSLKPGVYVVAVSGGVDSVVLLHMLSKNPDAKLVAAHFDHGIRADSVLDRKLVQGLAESYDVPFYHERVELGPHASEATARKARYGFLRQVQKDTNADGIITAHHQDDVLETAILNLLRGTNRKGLSSLKSVDGIFRPFLHVQKSELKDYARANGLIWREDSTNSDLKYKRNAVRHKVLPKLTPENREVLLHHINRMHEVNREIDDHINALLAKQPGVDVLDRKSFARLPFAISRELVAAWLRKAGVKNLDRKGIYRIAIAGKTYVPGQQIDVDRNYFIEVKPDNLALLLR